MNQFRSAWNFYFNNWQFFAVLAAPVFFVEVAAAYLVIPLENATQPDDIIDFFSSNSGPIGLLGFLGMILSISFLGGMHVAFDAKYSDSSIEPLNALLSGFKKFFPLFGAYILSAIVVFFGLLLLILPGIYVGARLALFPAYIMLQNKGVLESLKLSWENTDEHGRTLFSLTIIFALLSIVLASIFSFVLDTGLVKVVILGIVEYVIIVPWIYIYYSLYKSQISQ
ncbi:MAG: hypothetical protein O2846_03815 [Proteobacteria bacterium]|nr:hypothetical protein [Pseudomonadota bacterium]MDA0976314.1 hypothetical protein [Pseudomonadota bacterium]MDA1037566.1 hypothetical protein [Pseudomonadota bacterium]